MYKNYFLLNRMVIELNEELQGSIIKKIFTQEKSKLVISLGEGPETTDLIISVYHNEPFLRKRKEFHRARRNSFEVFPYLTPTKLIRFEIAENDRIIKMVCSNANIFFFIRGKDTNVIAVNANGRMTGFKKIYPYIEQKIRTELEHKKFSSDFNMPDFDYKKLEGNVVDNLQLYYPYINKDIINEVLTRTKENKFEEFIKNLCDVLEEIKDEKISVFRDPETGKNEMSIASFLSSGEETKTYYTNYQDALNNYLISRHKLDRLEEYKKLISKNLEQHLLKISRKLNEISGVLERPSNELLYRKYGSLLLSNIDIINKGMTEITVNDFDEPTAFTIKLDEKLDAKGNINLYFQKSKDDRENRYRISILNEKLRTDFDKFNGIKKRFESNESIDNYRRIMEELNIKTNNSNGNSRPHHSEEKGGFRHYIIEKKYHLYVGRDSKSNDLLTNKFAKQNDYWFHARGVSGSHAVLRIDNTKEPVQKNILKKAASIAAFHSKARTSKLAPVTYALKKYVVKRKGMEPGKVFVTKEDVLLVTPTVPDDCEYLSSE